MVREGAAAVIVQRSPGAPREARQVHEDVCGCVPGPGQRQARRLRELPLGGQLGTMTPLLAPSCCSPSTPPPPPAGDHDVYVCLVKAWKNLVPPALPQLTPEPTTSTGYVGGAGGADGAGGAGRGVGASEGAGARVACSQGLRAGVGEGLAQGLEGDERGLDQLLYTDYLRQQGYL